MPKLNPYLIKENYKKVEEIREINNEYPSFGEFMKTYEVDKRVVESYENEIKSYGDIGVEKGYGPSPIGCGGGVPKSKQNLIRTFNDKRLGGREFNWLNEEKSFADEHGAKAHNLRASTGSSVGMGGAIASGEVGYSALRISEDGFADVRAGNVSLGGEIGMGAGGVVAKVELGADVANIKIKGVQARVGINLDTGGSVGPGGIEAKAAGFGLSVGKKTGISTPLGEASIDFEEACVVQ